MVAERTTSKIDGAILWLTSPRYPLATAREYRPPMKGAFEHDTSV